MAQRDQKLPTKKPRKKRPAPIPTPVHRWRLCTPGRHWVRDFPRHIPPSKQYPEGHIAEVRGHCANNPSHKDHIYQEEIEEIARRNFSQLPGGPKADTLGFPRGDDFDDLIRGWTMYWNEVFQPKEPLDPDLVKALIASESAFDPKIVNGHARGLMQVTDGTVRTLSDKNGKLRDHFVNLERADMLDPNSNICAGVRWLFRKREIAESKLGGVATWRDAVLGYKSARSKPSLMKPFDAYYKRLKDR